MEANKSALLVMNQTDAEKFAISTGKFTDEERDYLVKEGLMYERDGQFFEISTLTEGDFTDDLDDSMKENINPISRNLTSLPELTEQKIYIKKVPLSDITKDMGFSDMDVSKLNESFAPLKLVTEEEQMLNNDSGRSRLTDDEASNQIPDEVTKEKLDTTFTLKTSSSDGSFVSAYSRLSNTNISFRDMDVSNLNASYLPFTANTTRLANYTDFLGDMNVTKLNETFEPVRATKDMPFSNMDVTKMNESLSFALADETANKGNSCDLNVTRLIHDHGKKKDSAVGNEDVFANSTLLNVNGTKLPFNITDVTLSGTLDMHDKTTDFIESLIAQANEFDEEEDLEEVFENETCVKQRSQGKSILSPSQSPLKSKLFMGLERNERILSLTSPRHKSIFKTPISVTPKTAKLVTPGTLSSTPRRRNSYAHIQAKVDSGLRRSSVASLRLDSPVVADHVSTKPIPLIFPLPTGHKAFALADVSKSVSRLTVNRSLIPRPTATRPSHSLGGPAFKWNSQMSASRIKFAPKYFSGSKQTMLNSTAAHQKENFGAEHTRDPNPVLSVKSVPDVPKKCISKLAIPRSYVQ